MIFYKKLISYFLFLILYYVPYLSLKYCNYKNKRLSILQTILIRNYCNNLPLDIIYKYIDMIHINEIIDDKNNNILTFLCENYRSINKDTINKIINKGINTNHINNDENNALFCLIDEENIDICDKKELMDLLIDNGINLNFTKQNGINLLTYYCYHNNIEYELIKYLLDNGIDINNYSLREGNALMILLKFHTGCDDIIKLLVESDIDLCQLTPDNKNVLELLHHSDTIHKEYIIDKFIKNKLDLKIKDIINIERLTNKYKYLENYINNIDYDDYEKLKCDTNYILNFKNKINENNITLLIYNILNKCDYDMIDIINLFININKEECKKLNFPNTKKSVN